MKTWFRSHRIFRADSSWYFHTREGIDVGPFVSEFEAQVEASILAHVLRGSADSSSAVAAISQLLLDVNDSLSDLTA